MSGEWGWLLCTIRRYGPQLRVEGRFKCPGMARTADASSRGWLFQRVTTARILAAAVAASLSGSSVIRERSAVGERRSLLDERMIPGIAGRVSSDAIYVLEQRPARAGAVGARKGRRPPARRFQPFRSDLERSTIPVSALTSTDASRPSLVTRS